MKNELIVPADELRTAVASMLDFARQNVDRLLFLQREGLQIASGMTIRLTTGQVIGARIANAAPGGLYPVIRCEDGTYMNLTYYRREDFMTDGNLVNELMTHYHHLMRVSKVWEETEEDLTFFSEKKMCSLGKRVHALMENGKVWVTRNPYDTGNRFQ